MKKKALILLLVFAVVLQIVSSITRIEVNETDLVDLQVKSADPDYDQLEYKFTKPLDAEGKWQTAYGDAGEYPVTVTVSDGQLSTSEEILLVVYRKEEPPSIDAFEPEKKEASIDEGKQVSFRVYASDMNKDELTYLWELDGEKVSEDESYLYLPYYGDAGKHKIKVNVADKKSSVSQEWNVTVNKVDRTKLLEGFTDIIVDENEKVEFLLPDFNAYNLNYSISEPVGNDGAWQTTYDDAGEYDVTVKIWDGKFTAQKEIKVTVNNVDRAPIFDEAGILYVNENQEINKIISATDPDGDLVKLSADNLTRWCSFSNNTLRCKPDYDTVNKEGVLDNILDKFHLLSKTFLIGLLAKSNELVTQKEVKVVVRDSNRPPKLENLSSITVNEGEKVKITPNAIDPDGDKMRYSYSGWMNFDEYTTNYDDAGAYFVRVTASDGEFSDSKDVKITVNNVNRPPVFNQIRDVSVEENSSVEIRLVASDPDNDEVAISAKEIPDGASLKGSLFKWTPGFDAAKNLTENVEAVFIASDGNLAAEQKAVIIVFNKNRAPEIINATEPKITARVDEPVILRVHAEDPDGDQLSYIWKFGLFEKYNATEIHQRTFTKAGEKEVKVDITDGKETVSYGWTITVLE